MLANLLFSLNMSLPIFVILGIGCALACKRIFTEDYIARTTDLVYYVLLPAKLFLDIATSDLASAFDGRYVAVTAFGVIFQFLVAWAAGNLLCRDKRRQSAFSHACFRGNFVYLGLALLQSIYGVTNVPSATVILVMVMPLYNIQGVILMTAKEGRGGIHLKPILLGVLKNPMVISLLMGIPFAYFQIELPHVAAKSLDYLRSATSTMALLVVGASIRPDTLRGSMPLLVRLSAVKLLLMPAIWGGMAALCGLTREQIVTLTIVGAMPAAVNVYIITEKMGGDGHLASGAVVVTHLFSLFTMTGIVFLLRTLGMI